MTPRAAVTRAGDLLLLQPRRRCQKILQGRRDATLGMIELLQINLRIAIRRAFLHHQLAPGGKPGDGRVHGIFIDIQERRGIALERHQAREAMAAIRHLAEHVQNSRLHAQRKITADADVIRQTVRQKKADAMHLSRQGVRIFPHLIDRVGAKDSIDPERQRSAYAMALQKHHHVLHAALRLPRLDNSVGAHFADAVDFENPQRLFREDFQRFQTESRHQSFCVSRTDSLDHAGAEIFFDALAGGGIDLLPVVDLKLQAVARMALPHTGDFDFFAFGNRKDRTDDRYPRATVFIQARHGVMRFGVLVGDPADRALNRRRVVGLFRHYTLQEFHPTRKREKRKRRALAFYQGGDKIPTNSSMSTPAAKRWPSLVQFFDNSAKHARLFRR